MEGKIYINGEWLGEQLPQLKVMNPATNECIGTIKQAGISETKNAIVAANEAFRTWSKKTPHERFPLLMEWHDLILQNKQSLAKTITEEMGKPIKESIGEIEYAASFISWFAEEAKRIYGRSIPSRARNKRIQVMKQPIGVVAAITPWNFPAAMLTRKMAPALASGCTIVVKPAEETPLTAIKLIELSKEAGISDGVINLVTGDAEAIGKELTTNSIVRKLTFTGSTEVGKLLMQQSAETMQNLSLELGGHAPAIVCEDAKIDEAVNAVIASKFRNAGQTCICVNRVYVQHTIYEEFITKLIQKVAKLKVGRGLDEQVQVGPLINKKAYEKVKLHIDDATRRGATVRVGGDGYVDKGYYFQPTVLIDVTDDMLIMKEETFGPVIPVTSFQSDEEAISRANHSCYGLAAYFFTESMARGLHIAEELEYGIIGWNDGAPSMAEAPFGGMKESGIGREGGTEGLETYLETKYISLGI
ncbi:NAD-dependent succinate-semialdehyde dehydrogenase [Halalkalibacter sp. APA_J-10(15)]|uniref:NAD-dependent succinate-semialdehyde dehydrogenase n=1 Tax=Halalkalibacter sp. APA_J-10(15) TaxID=2933805 RepID=UPI0027E4F93C|nr:NAD-dependent succinate-semialdehyde dehydrogenase [Halalkalibacter sp. APA_J-10(15)]